MSGAGERKPEGRILLSGDGGFLAHVSRLVELGRCLRDTYGHTPVFALSGKYEWLVRDEGFQRVDVYTPSGDETLELVAKTGLVPPRRVYRLIRKGLEADLECLDRVRPDIVVGDMRWSQKIATELRGIPYATILNAFWTRYATVAPPALPGHWVTRLLGRRAAGRLMPRLKRPLVEWAARPFRNLRKSVGLDPSAAHDLYAVMDADLTLLPDIPEFATTERLPEHYRYVGPITCEHAWPDWTPPRWFDELDRSRPLVYISQGSTGSERLFEEAAKVFACTAYQVVMTTAGQYDPNGGLPPNVHAVDYAPGRTIMERADVVVCHGGNGTVYQAIRSGCPLIGAPIHVDQSLNVVRLRELGLGVELLPGARIGERLREAVEQVVGDASFRAAARRMQSASLRYDGAPTAAANVHAFLAGRAGERMEAAS